MNSMRLRVVAAVIIAAPIGGELHGQGNFWASLDGPGGGIVQTVAIDPADGAVFAGTSFGAGYNQTGGSVFKSIDRGSNWVRAGNELAAIPQNFTNVRAIAVSAAGHVYVGMDPAGVYRSVDGGVHWSSLNAGLPNGAPVREVAIAPTGEVMCCVLGAGVYQLNAAGTTWSSISAGLTNLSVNSLAFGPGYALVGTRGGGVFKRIGAGTWVASNIGLSGLLLNDVLVLPSGVAYACSDAGVSVSNDAAATWSAVVGPFTGGYVGTLAAAGSTLLVGTTLTGYRSADDGANWTPIMAGQSVRAFAVDSLGRVYAGTNQLGMLVSDDEGATWTPMIHGLSGQSVFRVMQTGSGLFAGTQRNGIIRSRDGGQTWDAAQLPERTIFALEASPWGDLFAGNYNIVAGVSDGHAWRSTDGGDSWQALNNGLNAAMVSGFVFPSPGEVLCSSAWNPGGVSRSTNNGDSWSRLGPPQNIPAYFLARSPTGDLYIGSEGDGVWKLPAGGSVWEFKGIDISQQFSMAFDSNGHVYICNDSNTKGIWRSIDNGQTFAPVNSFPSNWGYSVVVAPNDDVYVATRDVGVQRSTDGGDTWQSVNSGISTTACYALAIGADGYLYAGSAGHGMFRSVLPVAPCAADFDGSGSLGVPDIFAFLSAWFANDARADFDGSGSLGVPDIFAFLSAWFAGCP